MFLLAKAEAEAEAEGGGGGRSQILDMSTGGTRSD
jgi:hypothetical protein